VYSENEIFEVVVFVGFHASTQPTKENFLLCRLGRALAKPNDG